MQTTLRSEQRSRVVAARDESRGPEVLGLAAVQARSEMWLQSELARGRHGTARLAKRIHEVDFETIPIGTATIRDIASKRQYGQVILEEASIGD